MIKKLILVLTIVLTVLPAKPSYASIASEVVIERFVYDGQVANDFDEYVKICNISSSAIDLSNGGSNPWLIGDAETFADTGEGLYELQGTLNAGNCFIIALQGASFNTVGALIQITSSPIHFTCPQSSAPCWLWNLGIG